MARAVFLGLLALNLVLFGWHVTVDQRSQARADAAEELRAPLLSLVDENAEMVQGRLALPDDASNVNGEQAENNVTARRCLSLGPFMDDAELAAAQLRLGAMGLTGEKRLAEGQIWVGYWIYLPPTDERADAVAMMGALRKRGVMDLYIEPAGEWENAVSLGVFSERPRAQRRFREIRDLGFEPQIARRNRQGTVYWLDFVPDETVRIDPGDFQVVPGRIVRLASRICQ